jgi:hypothetical protein
MTEHDSVRELDARWDKAIKDAPPAIIRAYFFNITKISTDVLMYGIINVCLSYGVEPEYLLDYIEDEPMVRKIAAEKGIDLTMVLTKGEWAEYQTFVLEVFKDVIKSRDEVGEMPRLGDSWRTDRLDA